MLDTEEYKGYWYLPNHQEIQINGLLTFGPEKAPRLNLNSAGLDDLSPLLHQTKDFVIWGFTLKGELVTLFNCNQISSQYALSGIQTAVLNAQYIIIGMHVAHVDTKVFSVLRVSFDNLEEWMETYGYLIKRLPSSGYEINYNKPDDIIFNLHEDIKGALTFWNNSPMVSSAELTLMQQNLVKLEFATPRSLMEITEIVWKFQRFFTLVTLNKVKIRWFYLYADNLDQPTGTAKPLYELKDSKVFFQQSNYEFGSEIHKPYLLSFKSFKCHFEMVINHWFRADQELTPIIDILHVNIGNSNEYLHNRFLNLVQAVEAYHRRKMQDTVELKKANEVKVARILLEVFDKNDNAWLKQKLAYSYEPGLRNRLKELFNLHKDIMFSDAETNDKKIIKLINALVDKRNYLTHYDKLLEEQGQDAIKIIGYIHVLKSMLMIIVLRELGFDAEFIKASFSNKLKTSLV